MRAIDLVLALAQHEIRVEVFAEEEKVEGDEWHFMCIWTAVALMMHPQHLLHTALPHMLHTTCSDIACSTEECCV